MINIHPYTQAILNTAVFWCNEYILAAHREGLSASHIEGLIHTSYIEFVIQVFTIQVHFQIINEWWMPNSDSILH